MLKRIQPALQNLRGSDTGKAAGLAGAMIANNVIALLASVAFARLLGDRYGSLATLISYLLIYPALWKLRGSRPEVPRPFRMPFYRVLTVVLMILVFIASVQLIAPGLGDHWFGSDFIPDGWAYSERWVYLWTELIPVLFFIGMGVLFWWLGRATRSEMVTAPAEEAAQQS